MTLQVLIPHLLIKLLGHSFQTLYPLQLPSSQHFWLRVYRRHCSEQHSSVHCYTSLWYKSCAIPDCTCDCQANVSKCGTFRKFYRPCWQKLVSVFTNLPLFCCGLLLQSLELAMRHCDAIVRYASLLGWPRCNYTVVMTVVYIAACKQDHHERRRL